MEWVTNHVVEKTIIHSQTLVIQATTFFEVCEKKMKRLWRFLVWSVQPPQLSGQSANLLKQTWAVIEKKWVQLCGASFGKGREASTLSDMLSVMLRSRQSLGPEIRASAKRSLVIAFRTRLVNLQSKPSVPDCEGKKRLMSLLKPLTLCITLHLLDLPNYCSRLSFFLCFSSFLLLFFAFSCFSQLRCFLITFLCSFEATHC